MRPTGAELIVSAVHGDLGSRMAAAIDGALGSGARRVIVIGSA